MTVGPPLCPTEGFAGRVAAVHERIAAVADPAAVRVVAVTKGFGVEAVLAALSCGLELGENYADELVAKSEAVAASSSATGRLTGEARTPFWHFLGAVQRNKVARLAPTVGAWQGLRRIEEGRAIASRRPGSHVLVQVDVAGLPARGGCRPEEAPNLVASLRELDLEVDGLMAVGPPGAPEAARPGFCLVSRLADTLDLPVRSMGMSDDFEVALSEGSTMVRLGRVLFGDRPPRRDPVAIPLAPEPGTTL